MPDSAIFRPGLLDGRVALVTGGGTNLGRQAARELVACGATVVIAGRREEVLAATAGELGCDHVAGDVRDDPSAAALLHTVLARHGRLDVLVNNAGGQYWVPAEGIALKGWRAVQRLNVGGTLRMCELAQAQAFGPQGSGTIVNVTVSPHRGMPAMAHTGAARAAVEALGRDLAARWPQTAVISLALGRFATESLQKYPAVVLEGAAQTVPLQSLGSMDDFAWLVALLASPLGARLSGSTVTLDGALDNWDGPWPTATMVDESGAVPTEARQG